MLSKITVVQPRMFSKINLRQISIFWTCLVLIVVLVGIPLLQTHAYSLPYIEESPEAVYYLAAQEARGLYDAQGYNQGRAPIYPAVLTVIQTALDKLGAPNALEQSMRVARFLAALTTLLGMVLVALTARLAAGDLAGLIAGAAWGGAPMVLLNGIFALPDPVIYMMSALTLWLAASALANPKRLHWCLWSIASGLTACLVKYTALPLIMPGGLVLLWVFIQDRRAGRQLRKRWLVIGGLLVGAALFACYFGISTLAARPVGREAAVGKAEGLNNLMQPSRLLNNLYYAVYPIIPALVGAVCALGVLAWIVARRRGLQRVKGGIVGIAVVAMIFMPWIPTSFDLANPGYRMRDVLPGTVAVCILLGIGVGQIVHIFPKRWQTMANLVALAVLAVVLYLPDVREAQEIVADRILPDRRVALRLWADTNLEPGTVLLPNGNSTIFNPYWGGIVAGHWFDWQASGDYMQHSVDDWQNHRGISYVVFPQWTLQEYQRSDAGRAFLAPMLHLRDFYEPDSRGPKLSVYRIYQMEHETGFTFGSTILMSGYDQSAEQAAPGDTVTLRFYWQATQVPDSNYSLFVHLTPPDTETVISQVDNSPAVPDRPTLTWDDPNETLIGQPFALAIPSDLAPGTYAVRIGLYDYLTGARLPIKDANGNAQGDSLALVTLTVNYGG
jgi:dolichyl-phosphate-mannose-protein mannosyltransferase